MSNEPDDVTAPAAVLLVDDHTLIRDGLRRGLEGSGEFVVVAEAATLSEGRERFRRFRPDVVVVDVRLTDGNGLELVREITKSDPRVGTVVITMYAGDTQMVEARNAGASAFVTKDAPTTDVLAAVRSALSQPDGFAAQGWDAVHARQSGQSTARLTSRETEVLTLLVSGLSISGISRRLFVSESTAKTHVANIYAKLGAANRAQAVATALRDGLVLPE